MTFFALYYFLTDSKYFIQQTKKLLPLEKRQKQKIFNRISEITKAVIYGEFVVALIEGIIGALIFQIAGVNSPILWGVIIGITAIVPMVGAAIIWVPAAILLLIKGSIPGAIILVVGGMVIAAIETFVKPMFIGGEKIHPILVFIGFLGGVSLFGFIGIILGPLILALLTTMINMYETS